MQRYAQELSAALRRIGGSRWQLHDYVGRQPRLKSPFLPSKLTARLNSAVGRYLSYPLQAAKVGGEVFHVLDHGYAQLALALDRRKTIVTCHDMIPLLAYAGEIPIAMPRSVAYTFRMRLWCMTRAAYVIADSESTRRDLLRWTPLSPERIVVIPLGVSDSFTPPPHPEFRTEVRHELGISQEAQVIFHLATRARYKNTATLLRALSVLKTSLRLNILLLRVGADFFAEEQDLIEQLGLSDAIVHAGYVPDDAQLARFYQAADLFAFPSLWEGFGWPPLEAMACGTPVVTSDVASLPEIVGDAGLLVAPLDSAGLAQAMYELLTKADLRRKLIDRGLQRARAFSWERTAQKTLEVYEQIAAESPGGTQARLHTD